MGNFFDQKPTGEYDRSLLSYLKTKTLAQIQECYKYFHEEYIGANTLIFDEYKDIFGGLLENITKQLFLMIQNQHDPSGRVDVYESFATVVIFCNDQFEEKTNFLFRMFDFDGSGQLEKKELVVIFQTSIRVLCKMVLIPPPTLSDIELFATDLFTSIDENKDFSISDEEFFQYLQTSDELQDFLLRYARIQTYTNSLKKTKQLTEQYVQLWKKCNGGNNNPECAADVIIQNLYPYIPKHEEFEFITNLLISSSKGYKSIIQEQETFDVIHEAVYNEIMLALSAFEATDISNDGQIDMLEMRFIIYAYEGIQTEMEVVEKYFKERDLDQSGQITKKEWFDYLCLSDGSGVFKGELRRMFASADRDNNGKLELEEVKHLVKLTVGRRARKKEVLDQIVAKIFAQIDKNNDGSIGWDEFKNLNMEWLNP